jgi:hypothetical protein
MSRLRPFVPFALLLLTACSATKPWTVRVENARDAEVALVHCAIVYPGGGAAASSSVHARHATEFAAEREDGAPEVQLNVYWERGEPPTRARITGLTPATDGITVRLREPHAIELKDRQGNDAAVLTVNRPQR